MWSHATTAMERPPEQQPKHGACPCSAKTPAGTLTASPCCESLRALTAGTSSKTHTHGKLPSSPSTSGLNVFHPDLLADDCLCPENLTKQCFMIVEDGAANLFISGAG